MLLKRKIVHPIVASAKEIALETKYVKLPKLMEFQREISSADPKHIWGILRLWNEKLFGEFPDPEIHHQMLMLRIQYELVWKDYTEQKIKMPERIHQNYIASKHYLIEKLAPSLRGIMESLTKGENMATSTVKKTAPRPAVASASTSKTPVVTRVTSVGKANKETVTQTFVRLFEDNKIAQLTDVQLASKMQQAHPEKKKYTVEDIKSVRSMYNRGKLSIQKSAPKELSFVKVVVK